MVCFPYPKRMCANIDVDQAAAVILCSYEAAQRRGRRRRPDGVPARVAEAHDHYFFTERSSLAESPAIAAAVGDALAAAGLDTDDVARFDLYSCFPSAVQVAMRALGDRRRRSRPLTVTGGLGFAGGPVNNYPTHGIARMVEVLRADPASFGCTTALGWYITKHSAAVWSASPPERGSGASTRPRPRPGSTRNPGANPPAWSTADVTIEATSVKFERDGSPVLGIVSALTDDGRRALANARDLDLLAALVAEAHEGPDRAASPTTARPTRSTRAERLTGTVTRCNRRGPGCCGAASPSAARGAAAATSSGTGSRWCPTARAAACTSNAKPATGPVRSRST